MTEIVKCAKDKSSPKWYLILSIAMTIALIWSFNWEEHLRQLATFAAFWPSLIGVAGYSNWLDDHSETKDLPEFKEHRLLMKTEIWCCLIGWAIGFVAYKLLSSFFLFTIQF